MEVGPQLLSVFVLESNTSNFKWCVSLYAWKQNRHIRRLEVKKKNDFL